MAKAVNYPRRLRLYCSAAVATVAKDNISVARLSVYCGRQHQKHKITARAFNKHFALGSFQKSTYEVRTPGIRDLYDHKQPLCGGWSDD